MRRAGGYLTVYLSLTLALLLSFVLAIVEGARRHTVRMEAECIADIGMNSVLAEFHRELLEQYDLLFVDMSYGTSKAAAENSSEHLRSYMQNNCRRAKTSWEKYLFAPRDWLALSVDKAVVREYSIASDYGGNVMKRQALEYMKDSSVEGMLVKLSEQAAQVKNLELDTRDLGKERAGIQSRIDAIELPVRMNEEGQEETVSLDNPADKVEASRGSFTLGTVLGKGAHISGTVIRPENYISHRERKNGTGISPGFREPSGMTEDLLFDCYLFEKCGFYGKELEKSLLKYQIEYIIAGKGSDMENLDYVVKRLLLWREAANVMYIFTDTGKCAEAELLASSLTAVLFVPELAEPVKYAILFAWAYMESVRDVKCLLNGGKVPLLKTAADWRTGIADLADFPDSISGKASGGRGLDYGDYLRVMLFLENDNKKTMRSMDVMEMDIRMTPGNEHFRMDACFDSYVADISISSAFGYHYEVKRRYGYD